MGGLQCGWLCNTADDRSMSGKNVVKFGELIQTNPLKWTAQGPDYEYALTHVLYSTVYLNGTRQTISI